MGTGSSILSTQNVLIYGNLLHADAAALGGNDFTDIKNTKDSGFGHDQLHRDRKLVPEFQ